ncbi:anthranilate phosphoribosyltransferase [Methylosinus sp. Sm6]|uniref:anthranilate phosphoribosyltransferase n=1 Tax=Methylosinus sp. Sm6 TaxID=2866948 RepID=UPI001C98EE16|nr:anthranilate phosphoribosyltransferase [Methylosinus sp. Sm6]MBY6241470.1 anthranilate phosphoribosyltransferase [Methylosinus sp. Sm6]
MTDLVPFLATIATGATLSRAEARAAVSVILEGGATPAQLGAFLMGLRLRGESLEEIIGGAVAMRAAMAAVEGAADAIDIVGTGGDGAGTYNVSTLAALIVAGCGVRVAKHGGRAASSRSGATDVLAELGVRVGVAPAHSGRCLAETGLCFMAAPTHHPALRHAAAARGELKLRTLFNLLGPLCNPARAERQLIGAYSKELLEPLARALAELGARRAWLVHGTDGLDELTTTGPSHVVALEDGALRSFSVAPEEAGLARAAPAALVGGDPAHNARALRAVLEGERNAYRDIAVLNAAAALIVAEAAADLREGAALAARALDSGAAKEKLEALVRVSNRPEAAAP